MKSKEDKSLYYLYALYIVICVFSESQLSEIHLANLILGALRYFIIFIIALTIISKKKLRFKKKIVFLIVAFLISTIINVLVGGGASILLLTVLLFYFYVYDINTKEVTIITIKSLLFAHIFVVLLSLLGLVEDRVNARYLGGDLGSFFAGTYYRHTYGFLVQNQIPLTLLVIYILRIVYKKENMKMIEHILFAAVNFFFYFTFGSRISFILVYLVQIGFFVCRFIIKRRKSNKTKKFNLFWLSYPICFCVSVFVSLNYDPDNHTWLLINNIFMNRFIMSYQAVRSMGIKLFGAGQSAVSKLEVVGLESSTIDNGYINILVIQGIAISVMIVAMWSWLTYQAEKNRNFYLAFVLVAIAVLNLIDAHLTSYKMMPFFCMMVEQYKKAAGSRKKQLHTS